MRTGPKHPLLAAAGFKVALPLIQGFYARHGYYQPTSAFAMERLANIRMKLERGETSYVAGIGAGGNHNTGVALVELTAAHGAKLLCNNEEERFSAKKHTTQYPRHAIENLLINLARMGIGVEHIDAWIATWDYSLLSATWFRTALEECPASLSILSHPNTDAYSPRDFRDGLNAPKILGKQLGLREPMPIILMQHHENHAWFSFFASPFARCKKPVIVAVLDGMGDRAAITLYTAENEILREFYCNESLFDSLGYFYSVISSTQGGWTVLSSEGRYMGAAAYGNQDRLTNPFYAPLRQIFSFLPGGRVLLNRSLANWPRKLRHEPYTKRLTQILGSPITSKDLWNPDAVLNVDDIKHNKITRERVDKAAATQMVFEDALFHIIGNAIRETASDRLVLSGGVALNAVANMRLLEHFDEAYYQRTFGKRTRLRLWVPPTPNDAGVTIGAAYRFSYMAGVNRGQALEHAFYCGSGPSAAEIIEACKISPDVNWLEIGDASSPEGCNSIADLMAFITSQDGVLAVVQGPAETGPRALGHRSILANPCNPNTRQILNSRVKYREAVRPLAPMMTLEAARQWFELSDGAKASNYNAYNYMVITARAKPDSYNRIPAVVHADGTGRIQIVREATDPLTHAYLKALGRRIGVEVAVNTSFNVAGPIVQTPLQALETLRRSTGIDVVFFVAENRLAFAGWTGTAIAARETSRFGNWLGLWRAEAQSKSHAG